jgi:transposase
MVTVGLDYHTKTSYLTVVDEKGEKTWEGEMASVELPRFFRTIPGAEVLFEAGYGWPRLVNLLEGIEVKLHMCHAEENRRIATDRRKSDSRDARNLAVYMETGTYKPAYMPDDEIRDERQFIRGRMYMVCKITRLKNQIQSLLAYAGVPKESMDIFAKKNGYYFDAVDVPEMTREILDANLESLDVHREMLKRLDARMKEMNRKDPRARLLKTIPGVGDVTARVLLSEVGDIGRFRTAKSLACYAGLVPRQRQSGGSMRAMGLTKEGSAHIRHVMVQAAWIAVRLDPALREFYEKLKDKKGSQIAICAVARKMVTFAWHILTKEVPYRAQKPKTEGKPAVAREKAGHSVQKQTTG